MFGKARGFGSFPEVRRRSASNPVSPGNSRELIPDLNILFGGSGDGGSSNVSFGSCSGSAAPLDVPKTIQQIIKEGRVQEMRDYFTSHIVNEAQLAEWGVSGLNADTKGKQSQSPLHAAIESESEHRLEMVRFLVNAVPSLLGSLDRNLWTPLHVACFFGHLDVINYLLNDTAYSCHVDTRSVDMSIPLHYFVRHPPPSIARNRRTGANNRFSMGVRATQGGSLGGNSIVSAQLMHELYFFLMGQLMGLSRRRSAARGPSEPGASDQDQANKKPRLIHAANKHGETPLHIVCRRPTATAEVLLFLLQHGADVNAVTNYGDTALHIAVRGGNKEVVRVLVDWGADVSLRGYDGADAREMAASVHATELLQIFDKYEKDKLRQERDRVKGTAKQRAQRKKSSTKEFKSSEPEGMSKGDAAFLSRTHNENDRHQRPVIHLAIEEDRPAVVRYLLDNKGEKKRIASFVDRNGWTPLHVACYKGNVGIAEYLIELEPSLVNVVSIDQSTPLHYLVRHPVPSPAVCTRERYFALLDKLLGGSGGGAGYTSISSVSSNNLPISSSHHTANSSNSSSPSTSGNSPNHSMGAESGVTLLKRRNINLPNRNGDTPLHVAVSKGSSTEILLFLLQNNANVNVVNKFGDTGVHMAVRSGNLEFLRILVEWGADLSLRGREGTVHEMAETCGLRDFLSFLDSLEKRKQPRRKKQKKEKRKSIKKSKSKLKKKLALESQFASSQGVPPTAAATVAAAAAALVAVSEAQDRKREEKEKKAERKKLKERQKSAAHSNMETPSNAPCLLEAPKIETALGSNSHTPEPNVQAQLKTSSGDEKETEDEESGSDRRPKSPKAVPDPIPEADFDSAADFQEMESVLKRLGLGAYVAQFKEEAIGMRALLLLTEVDLISVGVKLGHRRVLLEYIRNTTANATPPIYSLSPNFNSFKPISSPVSGGTPTKIDGDALPPLKREQVSKSSPLLNARSRGRSSAAQSNGTEEADADSEESDDDICISAPSLNLAPAPPLSIIAPTIQIADLTLGKHLGTGSCGDVYKGKLRGMTTVAIKKLTGLNQAAFLREAQIMEGLPNHPNVVTFYGLARSEDSLYIVVEYVRNGSLDKFLRNNVNNVDEKVLLQMAKDIITGMEHLVSNDIVHRDLACRNLLVEITQSGEHRVKVCDFGQSRPIGNGYLYVSDDPQIPIRWTAPEAILRHKYTSQSDIWSFGIVLYELFTFGQMPYLGMTNRKVVRAVTKGYRLPRPDGCPLAIYKVMTECWAEEPNDRPNWFELYKKITRIEKQRKKDSASVEITNEFARASEEYGEVGALLSSSSSSPPNSLSLSSSKDQVVMEPYGSPREHGSGPDEVID